MLKIKLSKNNLKIIYKLLNDLLLVLLVFLVLSLLTDSLITGLVTRHISFLKIVLLIALDLIAIYKVGTLVDIHIQPQKNKRKNKTTIFLVVIATLLIFNGLLKLNLWLNFFILFIVLIIIYLTYKNLDF